MIPSIASDRDLAELIEELSAKLEDGAPLDLSSYLADHPDHESELRRLVPALRLLADFSRSGSASVPFGTPDIGGLAEPLGDFRIIREVGRGGMGVVYEAEQLSLNRRVALKVLPLAATLDPKHLQRFRHEAQAAAMLHHPHIVPVHGVGSDRGVHYYAMQLIEGESLAAVIAAQRQKETRPQRMGASGTDNSGSAPSTIDEMVRAKGESTVRNQLGATHFRRAAQLMAQAADALEYAHSMGVVHRDVKPANLLLDRGGHVWVTDFGLARLDAGAGLTMTGDLIGTLRYMAPEQALAKHGLVDHRVDVYSLGATLYELLTLTPAMDGPDKREILRAIAFDEPVPPGKRDRGIPVELETITLKALAKMPSERYATAGELADDLRRWLDDRAIVARPPTLLTRASKWIRRHAGIVATATVGVVFVLVLTIGGLAVNNWMIGREQTRTHAALKNETAARKQAMTALRSLTDDVVERQLGRQVTLSDDDRVFLKTIVKQWEAFAVLRGGGEESRAIRAEAHFRTARLRARLGELREARASADQALDMYLQLTTEFPNAPGYRIDLAASHNQMGDLLTSAGQRREAVAEHRKALALQTQMADGFTDEPAHRQAASQSHIKLASVLNDLGATADAQNECRLSLALVEQLAAEFPTERKYRWSVAASRHHLGNLFVKLGQWGPGEAEYRRAITVWQQLTADYPKEPSYREALADGHHMLGTGLRKQGKNEMATAEFRHMLVLRQELAADFPTVPTYRWRLAASHNEAGRMLKQIGQLADAEQQHSRALAIAEQLSADLPTVPAYRDALAESQANLGIVWNEQGKQGNAEDMYRRSLAIRKQLTADQPGVPGYRENLATVHNNLGLLLKQTKRHAEAEAEYRHALDIRLALAADYPDEPNHRQNVARTQNNLAIVFLDLGRPAEAEAMHRENIAVREQLFADQPNVAEHAVDLGGSYNNFGRLRRDGGNAAEAVDWHGKAIQTLAPVVDRDPRLTTARRYLRNGHMGRALALVTLNRYSDAMVDWDTAVELADGPDRRTIRLERALCQARLEPAAAVAEAKDVLGGGIVSPFMYYDAARVHALAAATGKDENHAARAVGLLHEALNHGYFKDQAKTARLKNDADLNPLRNRADFQEFITQLP